MKLSIPKFILDLIPTRPRTRKEDLRHEPPAIAHRLDGDTLQAILRESESGNMDRFFGLCRDVISGHAHAQAEFLKRKLAVCADPCHLQSKDPKKPEQVAIATGLEAQLESLPNWLDIQLFLLGSSLFPVCVVEKIVRPSDKPGWMYELAELRKVPHRLLDFSDGCLKIWDTDEDGNRLATRRVPDPMRYIIHRGHALTEVSDTWGGPMRAVLFWYLFSINGRQWWARFLDRYGAPFMEASYEEADDNARVTLSRAFSAASKLFGIAVPKGVELKLHQANATNGGDAFQAFHSVANEEMSKVIIGQTMSSTAANTGLGSNQGEQQEKVRQDIRQFDATRLAHTIRTQLLIPLCHLNGFKSEAPDIAWGGESAEDLDVTSDFLTALPVAGLEITDEGIEILSKRSGIPLRRMVPPVTPPLGQPMAAGWPVLQLAAGIPSGVPRLLSPAEQRAAQLRHANDQIAIAGAEEFADSMATSLEPIRQILALSTSADDFERRLKKAFPALPSRDSAGILAACMISNSANALLALPLPSRK